MKISTWFRSTTAIPLEWRQDFLAEWHHIRYLRARAVAWITLIYPVFTIPLIVSKDFFIPETSFSHALALMPPLGVGIFAVSAYLLFSNKAVRSPGDLQPRNIQATNIYLISLVILFDGVFAITWTNTGLNSPYIVGLFIYASLFYRPIKINLVIYLLNFLFYVYYISIFSVDFSVANCVVAYLSGALSTGFALIIATSLFDSIVSNFVNRRTIEQQAEILRDTNTRLNLLVNLDGLTQIANRRLFDLHLDRLWQQLGRSNTFLGVLLCDVDFFKRFNDTYGHLAGDQCLKQVAGVIEKSLKRDGDLVARYGGEEFGIILPNTGKEGAITIAEIICQAVRSLDIPHEGSIHGRVTISVGVAWVIPSPHMLPDQLLQSADEALYLAKHDGRDRFAYLEGGRKSNA
ncbi:diguanylate cyclase [Alkalinema sp. FACHB-956]|uniref:GGDEF domain-containing protein n=1 Tax=Alkalinema sp. FACHB-956 TaxID=2692768 RepID=UPI001688EBF3|nr:diguanylate cyclase [Alkalinema sp. FACHB-956]MBD2326877.1 GGDEF domain-containing protein [Alkalinema sp. FACHB-956]